LREREKDYWIPTPFKCKIVPKFLLSGRSESEKN